MPNRRGETSIRNIPSMTRQMCGWHLDEQTEADGADGPTAAPRLKTLDVGFASRRRASGLMPGFASRLVPRAQPAAAARLFFPSLLLALELLLARRDLRLRQGLGLFAGLGLGAPALLRARGLGVAPRLLRVRQLGLA